MPIFVDGVEINELFVDGVEQANAFVDGVEVFSADQLQFMFDDFNGSPNGTTVDNHISNTGQAWAAAEFDQGSAIQTSIGGQGLGLLGTTSQSSDIQPLFATDLIGFHCRVLLSLAGTDLNLSNCRIYVGFRSLDAASSTYVRYAQGSGQLTMSNNELSVGLVTHPSPVSRLIDLECWWDGTDMQGRVTVNGSSVTTPRIAMIDVLTPYNGRIYNNENQAPGSITGDPNTYEYTLQEYAPVDVPFP